MKVLITCGPTWVPIDDVRVISNISSGEMGHLIAEAFSLKKARVTLLEGKGTVPFLGTGHQSLKIIKYSYFDELAKLLKKELTKNYDIVVHAAAVSDFKLVGAIKGKISSEKGVTLKLKPTPKLIKDIKRLSPDSLLVGFKLEPNITLKNAFKITRDLFSNAGCDLVVANSLKDGYKAFILDADGNILGKATNKKSLANNLVKLLFPSFL